MNVNPLKQIWEAGVALPGQGYVEMIHNFLHQH